MKAIKWYFLLSVCVCLSCEHTHKETGVLTSGIASDAEVDLFDSTGMTISTRFDVPKNYNRVPVASYSFAEYLRSIPLHSADRKVMLYNGDIKPNQHAHAAVLDIDVGNRDLQQCADAIMRLRAEYLYEQKRYDEINFHFVNGFLARFDKWSDGFRIRVNGNQVSWYQTNEMGAGRSVFMDYMKMVFMYAGTPSLEKELNKKRFEDIAIGDVFIQGGSPGHAIIVMDVAKNDSSGNVIFLLAQSYMPAQDIHILKNYNRDNIGPWYSVADIIEKLKTPEWTFNKNDLKTF